TLGTVQSGKYRSPGNRQTQTCPSDCQIEKHNSSLQRTCLYTTASAHCVLQHALTRSVLFRVASTLL
ncbi:unnamed protein product, partial [Staurois parvus]